MAVDVEGAAASDYVVPPAAARSTEPSFRQDPRRWLRRNLFASPLSAVLTVVFGALIAYVAYRALRFVFVTGRWEFARAGLQTFVVGPNFLRGGSTFARLWEAIALFAAAMGVLSGRRAALGGGGSALDLVRRLWPALLGLAVVLSFTSTPTPALLTLGVVAVGAAAHLTMRLAPAAVRARAGLICAVLVVAAVYLVTGGAYGIWASWGGLLLTVFVAAAAITLSFPLGVLLALGRRSTFPLIRPLCVLYIELVRGVPLITLLFFGQFAFGFVLPAGMNQPDAVTRAIIMITLFTGAYVAEIVRGGLQSVPKGQVEAAKAIGLSPITTIRRIVLPQALRAVIPSLVGQFISLLKDVSLLSIIGLFDLLGVIGVVLGGEFRGQLLQAEAVAFVSLLYWVLCYSMSRASQRLETRLGVGVR